MSPAPRKSSLNAPASQSVRGTWQDDPWHFRRKSRRDFLFVGLVGGLGLSLGDFFKRQALAAQKNYESV